MLVETQSFSNLSILDRRRPGISPTVVLLNLKSCIIFHIGSSAIGWKENLIIDQSASQIFAKLSFLSIKKSSAKVKNSAKLQN